MRLSMRLSMRIMATLCCALLPFLWACQEQGQNPELWTVGDVHKEVGLAGGHLLACDQCHLEAGFKGVAADCQGCHLALYEQTTSPDHAAAGYPQICGECHQSVAWQPASVAHDTLGFPLEGAHGRIFCAACHEGNVFAELPTDCWSWTSRT